MRRGALLSLALASAALVPAAIAQTSRSPFLPPNTAAAPEVSENAPLQFCGYMGAGEGARYCLFDPASRRSVWLPVGGESAGMRLEGFDADTRTVQVVHGGRTLTLKLQSPTPVGGGGAAASTGPLPVAGQGQPNQNLVNSVVANPTPADEARRLEAVAAEVRRRRALRQAAAQQQQQQQQQQRPNDR